MQIKLLQTNIRFTAQDVCEKCFGNVTNSKLVV